MIRFEGLRLHAHNFRALRVGGFGFSFVVRKRLNIGAVTSLDLVPIILELTIARQSEDVG